MISVITPSSAVSSSLPDSTSSSSSSLLHKHRATLVRAPQPYGTIPRRKKNPLTTRPRSSSTSSLASPSVPSTPSSTEKLSSTVASKKSTTTSTKAAQFASSSFRSSLDFSYFSSSSSGDNMSLQTLSSTPSLHSLLVFDTPDSTRLGLWDTLKAHYHAFSSTLATTATSATRHHQRKSAKGLSRHRTIGSSSAREFSPPLALIVHNSAPVVTLDDTALILTSSTEDALLSLPNLGSLSSIQSSASGSYPVSVKAMDRFKALRSDTIPLKTFTYHETPVVEVKRPVAMHVRKYAPRPATKGFSVGNSQSIENSNNNSKASDLQKSLQEALPLPRHLAARETRSNSDYLRMMASELCMIRSRKLIAPLKPRGTLARRKDLFHHVKSSLSVAIELPREEDIHPLNNLLVGSWTSVSSTDSFLSATSSHYTTADESFE